MGRDRPLLVPSAPVCVWTVPWESSGVLDGGMEHPCPCELADWVRPAPAKAQAGHSPRRSPRSAHGSRRALGVRSVQAHMGRNTHSHAAAPNGGPASIERWELNAHRFGMDRPPRPFKPQALVRLARRPESPGRGGARRSEREKGDRRGRYARPMQNGPAGVPRTVVRPIPSWIGLDTPLSSGVRFSRSTDSIDSDAADLPCLDFRIARWHRRRRARIGDPSPAAHVAAVLFCREAALSGRGPIHPSIHQRIDRYPNSRSTRTFRQHETDPSSKHAAAAGVAGGGRPRGAQLRPR